MLQRCRSAREPLSQEEFELLMVRTFRHDPDYAREADKLIPKASTFLSDHTLRYLVRGDFTLVTAEDRKGQSRRVGANVRCTNATL